MREADGSRCEIRIIMLCEIWLTSFRHCGLYIEYKRIDMIQINFGKLALFEVLLRSTQYSLCVIKGNKLQFVYESIMKFQLR